jgi:uncharacterized protein
MIEAEQKLITHVRPGIEYIAFYASKEEFNESGGISYYGKVKSYRTYLRDECLELPKNSKDHYMRFELEDIKEVGPINTGDYGVRTVIYTTLYLLENAEDVHDLKLKSREEIVLYRKLKDVAVKTDLKLKRYKECYIVGDVKVELLGNKTLRIDDKVYEFRDGIMKLESKKRVNICLSI